MPEEVSLKELLGDISQKGRAEEKTEEGGLNVKEIIQIIKALRELQQPQQQVATPPARGKSPEERANIIWSYIVETINQLAKTYPDMTVKEVAEKLPQVEHIAKPRLVELAKTL